MTCCPSPIAATLAFTPCGERDELSVAGWIGSVSSARGNEEACVLHTATWTTNCWQEAVLPLIGEAVDVGDDHTWYAVEVKSVGCLPSQEELDEAEISGAVLDGLAVVVKIGRASISCPDCNATLYSMERVMELPESCDQLLDPVQIANDIPCTVCLLENDLEVWGDAEVSRQQVLICLEDVSQVKVPMVISCDSNNYRVTKVRQRCNGSCLTVVEAELDTLGLLDT